MVHVNRQWQVGIILRLLGGVLDWMVISGRRVYSLALNLDFSFLLPPGHVVVVAASH